MLLADLKTDIVVVMVVEGRSLDVFRAGIDERIG
jgi:hypothetical protein